MTVPGSSPLNYPTGAPSPVRRISQSRAPTTTDNKNVREGDEWLDNSSDDWYKLASLAEGSALWVRIGGTGAAAETLTGDSGGAVSPDANNNINVLGGAGIVTSGSGDTLTIDLTGGTQAVDSVGVDTSSGSGTDPVLPDGDGLITVTGAQVATTTVGANVIRTNSTAANAYAIDIQQTGVAASKDTTLNGVAHFDSEQFEVDEGFISLKAGGGTTQSFFIGTVTMDIEDVTGDGTEYTIVFDTETIDVGGDFNTSTGVFTAPVAGQYFFACSLILGGITSAHTTGKFIFSVNGTEGGSAFRGNFFNFSDAGNNMAANISAVLVLSAADAVTVELTVDSGTKVVDVLAGGGQALSNFQGYLIRET